MNLRSAQIKGRIKNFAKDNNSDARVLIRIYMMERLLERIAFSKYKNNFILKGGILVTAMVGINNRSTNDMDVTLKNINLSIDDIRQFFNDIKNIDLDDGIKFEIVDISNIMDQMEYPGIRVSMNAYIEEVLTPIKIDISTGDVITPNEICYNYKLLLEDRYIKLWTYNLETILAEKLQTIFSRGVFNTRMRDFYDIYILSSLYYDRIDEDILKDAFINTCMKRKTDYLTRDINKILSIIENDSGLKILWRKYKEKYQYAGSVEYNDVIKSINLLVKNKLAI